MKKIIAVILMSVMVLSQMVAFADSEIKLYLDGTKLESDVAPIIVNDRTMVPFRVIFEALGAEVSWSDSLKKVYANLDGANIILAIGSDKMITDTDEIKLDAPPMIHNDRTLVPVRAVCEALKCSVNWNGDTRSVLITTQGYTGPADPSINEYQEVIDEQGAYFERNNDTAIDDAVEIINNIRIENGLSALSYSEELGDAAYAHSKDMADNNYISHSSPDGLSFSERLDMSGIVCSSAAENLASGFTSADKVIESWMNSESHKKNILNEDFTEIGVGCYWGGENGSYWTLILIAG